METEGDSHAFDFDLDRGIREQVVGKLESIPLSALERNVGPVESGIYVLYHHGRLVYVGKASRGTTKSKRTLRARLNEHVTKIEGRKNIRLAEIGCRYLTFKSEWWVRGGVRPHYPLSPRMERKRIREQGAGEGSAGDRTCQSMERTVPAPRRFALNGRWSPRSRS